MGKNIQTVPIDSIEEKFFVRTKLDEDRVLQFADLYQAGQEMPPIHRSKNGDNGSFILVYGRHRKAALELLDIKEVECEIITSAPLGELIIKAFNENYGGPMPPTKDDIEHTIQLLVDQGVSQNKIIESMPFPASLGRKFLKSIKDKRAKAELRRALFAVSDGNHTANEAAEKFGVPLDKLKEELGGGRKRRKSNTEVMLRGATFQFKSASQKNAHLLKNTIDNFEDGEITEDQARAVFERVGNCIKQMRKAFDGWQKRFDVKISGIKSE